MSSYTVSSSKLFSVPDFKSNGIHTAFGKGSATPDYPSPRISSAAWLELENMYFGGKGEWSWAPPEKHAPL